MAEALIRLARATDGASCAGIYAPYVENTVISFEEHPPSADQMSERIERTLERLPWIVCQDGDSVVGYAYAGQHNDRAAYRWSADVSIYVDEQRHRAGVGRALYSTLLDILKIQGIFNVFAGISLPNPASAGFHESFGFQHLGTFRRAGFKHGRWVDVGWWQLNLLPPVAWPNEPMSLIDAQAVPAWPLSTPTQLHVDDGGRS